VTPGLDAIPATERQDADYTDDSVPHRDHSGHQNAAETIAHLVLDHRYVVDASADQGVGQSACCQGLFQALGRDCRLASGAMAFVAAAARRVAHQRDAPIAAARQVALDDFAAVLQNRVAFQARGFPVDSQEPDHPDESDVAV
jgi:hypothetical protein